MVTFHSMIVQVITSLDKKQHDRFQPGFKILVLQVPAWVVLYQVLNFFVASFSSCIRQWQQLYPHFRPVVSSSLISRTLNSAWLHTQQRTDIIIIIIIIITECWKRIYRQNRLFPPGTQVFCPYLCNPQFIEPQY